MIRPSLAERPDQPRPLGLPQPLLERDAGLGEAQLAHPPVALGLAALDIAGANQIGHDTGEALLGNLEGGQQRRNGDSRPPGDEIERPAMRPAEMDITQYRLAIGEDLAIGGEQQVYTLL